MQFDAPILAPFETVRPDWIDFNGHLNMAYYNVLFDHAVDHLFFMLIAGGPDYVETRNMSIFTAEAHVRYRRELKSGARVRASVQLLEHDAKRLRLHQELRHEEGWLAATSETLVLHIDMSGPRVTPFPPDVMERIQALQRAHDVLAVPEAAGQGIKLKPARAVQA